MYSNAIFTKSLPRVADTSRRKPPVDDSFSFFIDETPDKESKEEEAMQSLDNTVKKFHERLRKANGIHNVSSLETLISLQ